MRLQSILEAVVAVAPVFRRKNTKEIREFSELVTEQYEFLASQLKRVMEDYFEVSAKVREMHTEIFDLKNRLSRAVKRQCDNTACNERT